jgi:hypothetical protein
MRSQNCSELSAEACTYRDTVQRSIDWITSLLGLISKDLVHLMCTECSWIICDSADAEG